MVRVSEDPFEGLVPVNQPVTPPPDNVVRLKPEAPPPEPPPITQEDYDRVMRTQDYPPGYIIPGQIAAPKGPTTFSAFDEAAIKPRQWIYGQHYLRSFVSVLASSGGIGKTSLQIVEALAIVTGKPLLGEVVHEPCPVWLVNLEDPAEEMQRRILAAMKHYGIHPDEVRGRLFVDAGRDFQMKFASQTKAGITINAELIDYMTEKIPDWGIGAVFIDPFVAAHDVNENDNGAINSVVGEIRRIADRTQCAIGLVHHVRKQNGEDASIDSVRGAGSLIGAARAARVINRMSAEEATRQGIDEREALSIFRVDDGKANLAPPAAKTTWRKMQGVKLANGEWIGVAVPYELPDAFAGVTTADAKAIRSIIAARETPPRENVQSKDWVGLIVADRLGMNPTEKTDRAKIGTMLRTWIKTGVLAVETIFDPRHTREVRVVTAGPTVPGEVSE